MTTVVDVPVGRLNGVVKDWDSKSGWVKAPLREIVFNDRLTKQARLLWLWLASVPPASKKISWGECETMLSCGTKARRSCMSQLITEGYIDVAEDGSVIMNDPYEVYNNKQREILSETREEWKTSVDESSEDDCIDELFETVKLEKRINKEIQAAKVSNTSQKKPSQSRSRDIEPSSIIQSWNKCKPESYSSLRSLSSKQKESIIKHMKNLDLPLKDSESFICAVCLGLTRSHFWTKQIDQKGRNFNSVFGYGNPQDVKMRNIETLYGLGSDQEQEINPVTKKTYTIDQQDTIDAYRFVSMNLEQSRSRGDSSEVERLSSMMETIMKELQKYQINIEDI